MNPRLKTGLQFLGVILASAMVYLIWPKQPVYHGHTATYWLKQLDGARIQYSQSTSGPVVQGYSGEALTAIRHMGAKSLPYIITELRAHDSDWKLKLMAFSKNNRWFGIPFTSDLVRRERAIKACQVLGADARPAIPALGQALGYGSSSALKVLESFGPEAVTALAQALTNAPGCGNPYSTALALGSMGAKAKGAVPSLIWTFENHKITYPRAAAARSCSLICKELIEREHEGNCPEVQMIKRALIRGLADSKLVDAALEALANLGTNAPEAAPSIVTLLQDFNPRTRLLATNALHKVAPHFFDLAALNKPSASN